jgi:hypothetical protein
MSGASLEQRAAALPPADGDAAEHLLNAVDSLRLFQILESLGNPIADIARQATASVADDVIPELPVTNDGYLLIKPDQIRAFGIRSGIMAAAAVSSAVGENIHFAREMEEAFRQPAAD